MQTPGRIRRLLLWLGQRLCHHDYLLRYDLHAQRVWCECRHCLHATPGWFVGPS